MRIKQCHDGYLLCGEWDHKGGGGAVLWKYKKGENFFLLFITSTRKLFNNNFHLISLVIKFSVDVKLFFLLLLINISLCLCFFLFYLFLLLLLMFLPACHQAHDVVELNPHFPSGKREKTLHVQTCQHYNFIRFSVLEIFLLSGLIKWRTRKWRRRIKFSMIKFNLSFSPSLRLSICEAHKL